MPLAGTKGCGYCASMVNIQDSLWLENDAQLGGAIYATEVTTVRHLVPWRTTHNDGL